MARQNSQQLEVARKMLHDVPRCMWMIRTEIRKRPAALTTLTQFRILNYLSLQILSSSQVAEQMGMSLPSVSRIMKFLERKGWVKRSLSKEDRRGNEIVLTAKGKRILEQERKDVRHLMAKRIATMPLSHQKALKSGLKLLEVLFL